MRLDRQRRDLARAVLCGGLAVLPFLGLLRPGTYFSHMDVLPYLMPLRIAAGNALRSGAFPLWDPWVECGQSLAGNPIGGLFYPPFLLSLLAPPWWGAKLYLLVHYCLIGAAAFLLFRRGWRLHAAPAVTGAAMFAGCGYLQSMVFCFHFTSVPWLLLGSALWLCGWRAPRRSGRHSLAAGLCFGLAFLGGELEQVAVAVVLVPLASVLLVPWRGADRRRPALGKDDTVVPEEAQPRQPRATELAGDARRVGPPSLGQRLRHLGQMAWPGALVALGLAVLPAAQILVSYCESGRGLGLATDELTAWSTHPLRLVEFLVPYVWGIPDSGQPYAGRVLVGLGSGFRVAWAPCVSLGSLWVVLIAVRVRRRHRALARLLWVVALGTLLLALGRHTPLHGVFVQVVPLFRVFRYPEKWLLWFSFTMAALTALKLEAVGRSAGGWLRLIGGGLGSLAAVVVTLEAVQWRQWGRPLEQHAVAMLGRAAVLVLLWWLVLGLHRCGPGRWRRVAVTYLVPALLVGELLQVGLWRTGQFRGPDPLETAHNPAARAVLDDMAGAAAPGCYRVDATALLARRLPPRQPSTYLSLTAPARQLTDGSPACFGLRTTGGIFPNETARLRALKRRFRTDRGVGLYWDVTSSGYLVVPELTEDGQPAGGEGFPLLHRDPEYPFVILKNPGALPRLKLFAEWRRVDGLAEALDGLAAVTDRRDLHRALIVEGAAGELPTPAPLAATAPAEEPVTVLEDKPGRLRLRVRPDRAAFLFVGESYATGWEARVDDRPARVRPGNACFMAVWVPAGTHVVALTYRLFR